MIAPRRDGSVWTSRHRGKAVVATFCCLLLAGCGGRRSERVATVPVMAPPPPSVATSRPADMTVIAADPPAKDTTVVEVTPAERTTVVAGTASTAPASTTTVITGDPPVVPPASRPPETRPPVASVATPPRALAWDPSEQDPYGFDGDRYLSLVTPEEVDILRLRSRGDMASHLSRFLSEKEKENLRRRAAELTEIGAEPLQVGE